MRIFSLALLLVVASVARAQDFDVVATTPAAGDSAVALTTTVSFEFNAPLDTTARFEGELPLGFFAINPPDSISIDSVRFSDDLRRADFYVRHTANTDFVWVLSGAVDNDGRGLCGAYALSYSTSQSMSPWSVAGEASTIALVKRNACGLERLVVVLMDEPPDRGGSVVGAGMTDQWVYEVTNVRDGVYWPAVLADIDGDGIIEPESTPLPEIAYYSIDFIRESDSVVVGGASVSGINMFITVSLSVDSHAYAVLPSLLVYPNPARDRLQLEVYVDAPGSVFVSLFDMLGRRIAETYVSAMTPGRRVVELSISDLSPGVYVVAAEQFGRVASRPVVVAR